MTVTKNTPALDRLLTPEDTAAMLGVSLSWLAKARLSGAGPRFVKIGRSVRYPEPYIRDYVHQQTRSSTSKM
jgi:predicted DNA-binding transcriptional regulator AlpA